MFLNEMVTFKKNVKGGLIPNKRTTSQKIRDGIIQAGLIGAGLASSYYAPGLLLRSKFGRKHLLHSVSGTPNLKGHLATLGIGATSGVIAGHGVNAYRRHTQKK